MKAVAYNIKSFERECLAKANHKKHEITLISNLLTVETVFYAEGKEAVIQELAVLGIRYLVTRSIVTNHIDKKAAAKSGLLVVSIPSSYIGSMESLQELAEHTINNLDIFTH
jgi:lactate dehydrogenase-like 2-hydroxyacid dehydrogenase